MLRSTAAYFCLFMVLIAASNRWINAHTDASLNKDDFWLIKTFPNQNYDGVMVGDSRLYRGFSPRQIETQLNGRTVHNFGYSSARLTPEYLDAARLHLDPQSKAPFIVLAVTAHSLTQPLQGADNPHYDGFAKRNRATVWLSQRSAWVRRAGWPTWVADPTDRLLLAQQSASTVRYDETFDKRGFVASVTYPTDPKRALSSYRKMLTKTPVDQHRLSALGTWIQQTVAQGIRVVAMTPPRPPSMAQIERDIGNWSTADVRKVIVSAGAQWIDLKWDGLSTYDGSHLDPASAHRVSDQLGRALAEILKR